MILLTGASGFVGEAILKKLRVRGLPVRALARKVPVGDTSGVEWFAGDVQDQGSLIKAMQGVEKVMHLVGIIVPQGKNTFDAVHAGGTRHVVEAAKKAGVKKIVHMSALGTHAEAKSEYHKTKWKGEVFVRYGGLPYTIFRPSIIFGPGDNFLNMFAGMIRKMPVLPLVAGGRNRLQPVWVQDVAECFVRALDTRASDNKVYELGGPQDYSMRDLMQILMDLTGKRRPMISLPMGWMKLQAGLMEAVLPKPPITRDQLLMMQENNTCDNTPAQKDFGIRFAELIPTLKTYLGRK